MEATTILTRGGPQAPGAQTREVRVAWAVERREAKRKT